MLVGVQFVDETNHSLWKTPALFECESNLVTPIRRTRHSCIVGAGELLKELGAQFASWGLSVSLAEWASIYLIHEAKRRFGGVGGKTHTFVMRNDGKCSYGLGRNIREKEELLETFVLTNQLFMLSLDPSLREDRAKDFVDAGTRWLRDARRYLHKIEREAGKDKPAYITVSSRELDKIARRINAAMQSSSQTSEPEQ